MLGSCIGTANLFGHMINLQCQDRQPVDRPCRTFRIDRRIRQYFHFFVFIQKETVDQFHQVGTILIRLVYTAFDSHCLHRIDCRITDDIFQMPLYRINPVFQIKIKLYTFYLIRIMHGCIHIIRNMIRFRSLFKYPVTLFAEIHK